MAKTQEALDFFSWMDLQKEHENSRIEGKELGPIRPDWGDVTPSICKQLLDLKREKIQETQDICQVCGVHAADVKGGLILHRVVYRVGYVKPGDVQLVCKSCHENLHLKLWEGEGKSSLQSRRSKVVEASRSLIEALDIDTKDENFFETPRRYGEVMLYQARREYDLEPYIEELASQVFPCTADQMVMVSGIQCYGMCPHHLVPVHYKISIAYLPQGFALGLSKFARVAKALAGVPYLQETLTDRIRDVLISILGTQNVGVKVVGQHLCMIMRGVEQPTSSATTIGLGGSFRELSVKEEFLGLCREKSNG